MNAPVIIEQEIGGRTNRSVTYASLGSMVDYVEANSVGGSSHNEEADWAGATWDDALALARGGWSEHRGEMDIIAEQVSAKMGEVVQYAPEQTLGMRGGAVDMGRYMIGRPDCMWAHEMTEQPAQGPVVSVLVSLTAQSGIGVDHLLKRGAAVLALIDILDKLGAVVELYVSSDIGAMVDGERWTHSTVCKVKDSAELLDVDAIAFALAHPAMQRRLVFAANESEPSTMRRAIGVGSGYSGWGGCHNPYLGETLGATVVLDKPERSDRAVSDPVGWIKSALTDSGFGDMLI